MQRFTIIVCCFFLTFSSCHRIFNGDNVSDVSESTEPTFRDVKAILSSLDSNLVNREYVLIIPEAACHGCIDYTLDKMNDLCKTRKVCIVSSLSNELDSFSHCDCVTKVSINSLKREMEIYGITLVHLKENNQTELIYIDPANMEDEYKKILQ